MSDNPTAEEFSPRLDLADETLQPFDVREREGLPPMFKLGLVALALLLVAFVVLKLYQPGVRDRSDPPRITADNTPFKVPPVDAGGTQTPNQDKVVFEVMDGKSPDGPAIPAPQPETPVKMQAPEPVVRAPDPSITALKDLPQNPVTQPVAQPKPKPSAPKPVVIAQPAPTRPVASAPATGASDWVVQVASTRSQADAEAVWSGLQRKFPGLVAGTYSDIKRVDLAEKGIYYRTRVAGLANKSAAQSLCASFKTADQACFVAKR